ncbi:MAG: phosphoglycerate dehydrogenase [Chloroflexi bacterium]|nr:phosphoglycerate dehydrogenase [Chloroflexota bacterium]
MCKVLVSDSIAREGIAILSRNADVVIDDKITTDALLRNIPDYDALVVRSRTRVSAPVIDAATRLRVIGRAGVGLDNIDTDAAARRGITVVNSPVSAMVSVAEHTIGMMLSLARCIPQADASLRQGAWEKNKFMGVELSGKTLGIVGLGRIGSMVAVRAAAFGMHVIAVDPYVTRERALEFGATLIDSLEDLLAQSDFISIHTPLIATTRGLIGENEIAKMKPNARIIFCARGGVVDEQALLSALENRKIAGAALDVFQNEPPGDHPLLKHPNVVVTPHLGAMTHEAQTRAAVDVAEQVVKILNA